MKTCIAPDPTHKSLATLHEIIYKHKVLLSQSCWEMCIPFWGFETFCKGTTWRVIPSKKIKDECLERHNFVLDCFWITKETVCTVLHSTLYVAALRATMEKHYVGTKGDGKKVSICRVNPESSDIIN